MSWLAWMTPNDALRAPASGAAYTLLCALASWLSWGLARWLERRPGAGAIRLRRWRGWPLLGEGLSLAFALAFPFILVLEGTFSADDVGIRPVDWSLSLPWVLVVGAVSAAWLAFLWGDYWRRRRDIVSARAWRERAPRWASILPGALWHECTLATYRAALMPLAGSYWGLWLATIWKLLASRLSPRLNANLRRPGQRERVFLGWTLDWVGAILYLLSGSIWAALAGRVLCQAAAFAVARLIIGAAREERAQDASGRSRPG